MPLTTRMISKVYFSVVTIQYASLTARFKTRPSKLATSTFFQTCQMHHHNIELIHPVSWDQVWWEYSVTSYIHRDFIQVIDSSLLDHATAFYFSVIEQKVFQEEKPALNFFSACYSLWIKQFRSYCSRKQQLEFFFFFFWKFKKKIREAVTQRCSVKMPFLKISQNSQENTFAWYPSPLLTPPPQKKNFQGSGGGGEGLNIFKLLFSCGVIYFFGGVTLNAN